MVVVRWRYDIAVIKVRCWPRLAPRPAGFRARGALYLRFPPADTQIVTKVISENTRQLTATVPAAAAGRRLDQVMVELFPDYSRCRLQDWIKAGQVMVDGRPPRSRDKVWGGEQVALAPLETAELPWSGEALPLTVVHVDADFLGIYKPPGLVVHPAAGNWDGRLVKALLLHAPELAALPRAGIACPPAAATRCAPPCSSASARHCTRAPWA